MTFTTTFAAPGAYNLTAYFTGFGAFMPPATSAVVVQNVTAAAGPVTTTTSLSSTVNPQVVGLGTVLSASVSPASATGVITFKNAGSLLGIVPLSAGSASLPTTFSSTGTFNLTAVYGGASGFATSTSSVLVQAVNPPADLPSPPLSPLPVANFKYDAQGNLKTATQVIGTGTTGFSTQGSYDRLNRLRAIVDARNGLTSLDYDGLDRVTSVTDPRTLTTAYPRTGLGEATAVSSPDTGLATMGYDAEGNVTSRTDSRGVLASYTYDSLNRLTKVTYSKSGQPSQTLTWTYDQIGAGFSNGTGRLTSTGHGKGSSQYAYDAQGRLTSATQTVNAASGANSANVVHTVGYGYTAGNLTSVTYPSGRVASFSYTNGKPTAVRLASNSGSTPVDLMTGIQYQPFGPIAAWNWNYASGPQATVRTFDTTGRLIRHQLGAFMRDISYDAADRISAFTHYEIATG
ncbi:MAG: hypothetical protein EOO54_24535, partial [Haliea sp.]